MLMKPDIQAALAEVGLSPSARLDAPISSKLTEVGLSIEEILEDLAFISKNSASEHLRLRAAETVLKLHGFLRNDNANATTAAPQINIIIKSDGIDLNLLKPTVNYDTVETKKVS